MNVTQHVYTGHLNLKLMWKNEFAGFSAEHLDYSHCPALEVPGTSISSSRDLLSHRVPRPRWVEQGCQDQSTTPHFLEASIAEHGVILQQMLFGPCPAQLSLQVPPDTLEESLDGSIFRLGHSILLKLLEKTSRKCERHKSVASVRPLILERRLAVRNG